MCVIKKVPMYCGYSTAPITELETAMDFDFLFVLFMNHIKFGIIFLWCLESVEDVGFAVVVHL